MIFEAMLTEEGKEVYTESDMWPATKGSAGIDLRAIKAEKDTSPFWDTIKIKTGLKVYIKDANYVGLVIPRSSSNINLINTIGVIDSDYQGELILKCRNFDGVLGSKVAQIIFVQVASPVLKLVDSFSEVTERGEGGFGSTNV